MSAAKLKPPDLLKCTDGEFDSGIQYLGLKELLETISLIQKEQSREQENFNSLKNELDSLKKNSSQYKQIQREMKASQVKMSALMNKSMKCFQQQGNLHITKPAAEVDEKRNPGNSEKKPQENSAPNTKLPPENKAAGTGGGNQSKGEGISTGTRNVVKVENVHQNGSVPQENSTKSSRVTVSFSGKPETSQDRVNGVDRISNGDQNGGKTESSSGTSAPSGPSFKTSVSVNPQSMQNKSVNKETSVKNVENSKRVEPSVVKADPKLGRSTTPAVVYHMGRPVSVDQNLGRSRDQMLDEIRNFKRKSEPSPDSKENLNRNANIVSETSEGKIKKGSPPVSSEDEVDSGSGSVEGSPKTEKFVSSFSFPQKSQNASTKMMTPTEENKGKTTPVGPAVKDVTESYLHIPQREVIARAREVINTSGTASLAASSESDVRSSHAELNLNLDLLSESVPEELGESTRTDAVEQLREARAEAHPRIHDVPLDLNHENGALCVNAMREAIDETYRKRYKTRGLPSEVADHFLADCFNPKYTFEERIVLIRKKLWGDTPVVKCERGHPDGASTTETETGKTSESGPSSHSDVKVI